MSKLSLFDKIKILIDVASSSYLFIVALLFVVSLAFIFITTNKKNAKSSRITYIIMYLAIILVTCGIYYSSLSKMFDYMMNNLFIAIYFPNLAIYFAAIITSNIILWTSIFNFKMRRSIKRINVIAYSIIHYILILIINVITKNKLDVFTQKSVYENKQALGLIELSSTIFVVWILFLTVYKLIRNYQKKKYPQVKKVEKKIDTLLPHNAIVVKHPTEVVKETKQRVLPENINIINHPNTIKIEKTELIEQQKTTIMPENIKVINNPEIVNINSKEKEVKLPTMDDLFTLEDYKLVLKLLKEHKEKEKQETEEKLRKIESDQRKYSQIEEMYKRASK